MEVKHIFYDDLQVAQALIRRDEQITYKYLYQKCYPLFKSIYDNYHTGCDSCKEFIDEIYLVILSPSNTTGKCQMENYRGESSLASWIKTASLFYCYKQFELKKKVPIFEHTITSNERSTDEDSDRNDSIYGSIEIEFASICRSDAHSILKLMPNKRYSELIRLRYLEQMTNEETAKRLGMTMENYYNKHKLAKEQYLRIYRKEERL